MYNVKYTKKQFGLDMLTFHQAMTGKEAGEYNEAMKEEITDLKHLNTWNLVD